MLGQDPQATIYLCTGHRVYAGVFGSTPDSRVANYRTGVFEYAATLGTVSDAWRRYLLITLGRSANNDVIRTACMALLPGQTAQHYQDNENLIDQRSKTESPDAEMIHLEWKYTADQTIVPESPSIPTGQPGKAHDSGH